MTKKEIALNLAVQYTKIENVLFELQEKVEFYRIEKLEEERKYYRNQVRVQRMLLENVEASGKALGLTEKQWSDGLWNAYIKQSEAKREAEKAEMLD